MKRTREVTSLIVLSDDDGDSSAQSSADYDDVYDDGSIHPEEEFRTRHMGLWHSSAPAISVGDSLSHSSPRGGKRRRTVRTGDDFEGPLDRILRHGDDVAAGDPHCALDPGGVPSEGVVDEPWEQIPHIIGSLQKTEETVESLRSALSTIKSHLSSAETGQLNVDLLPIYRNMKDQIFSFEMQVKQSRKFLDFVQKGSMHTVATVSHGYFGALPAEIVYKIMMFLDAKSLCDMSRVNKFFKRVCLDDELVWKNLVSSRWEINSNLLRQKPRHKTWKWLYECKANIFPPGVEKNGRGSFHNNENGNDYEGEWLRDKRHGWGTGIMADGRRYDGCWVQDKRTGQGVFTWPDTHPTNPADRYHGHWKESMRHGYGVYQWPDGHCYRGQWRKGKRDGVGIATWKDGKKYIGQYRKGKLTGTGTFMWPDGKIYVGEWLKARRNGPGTQQWADGRFYEGAFINGKKQGHGQMIWPDGRVYTGLWKNNKRCGHGDLLVPPDVSFVGNWADDEPQGPGKLIIRGDVIEKSWTPSELEEYGVK